MDLFAILLFLHVLGAIVAFGPGFAAMVVGPMVAKEPQHANFYARTQLATARSIITPVAISMAVTGVGLIMIRGWGTLTADRRWLEVSILLYVVAVVYSMAIQAPAGRKLVELTATPPQPGSAPNPEVPKTAARVRTGGIVLSLLTVAIVFLMVAKPF